MVVASAFGGTREAPRPRRGERRDGGNWHEMDGINRINRISPLVVQFHTGRMPVPLWCLCDLCAENHRHAARGPAFGGGGLSQRRQGRKVESAGACAFGVLWLATVPPLAGEQAPASQSGSCATALQRGSPGPLCPCALVVTAPSEPQRHQGTKKDRSVKELHTLGVNAAASSWRLCVLAREDGMRVLPRK